MAPGYVGASATTTSPGSISVLQTRSITCWPPVVTSSSSVSISIPSAAITCAMQALTRANPSVGPYWSARAHDSLGDRAHQGGVGVGRERGGVRQAAGQRDHVVALGQRHQIAHRRGAHHLRPLREQRRIALDVLRRRALARRTGVGAPTGARVKPARAHAALSSIVTSGHGTARCTSPSTSSRGSASLRRWGSAPSCRRSSPARSPLAISRSISRTPRTLFCRPGLSCW